MDVAGTVGATLGMTVAARKQAEIAVSSPWLAPIYKYTTLDDRQKRCNIERSLANRQTEDRKIYEASGLESCTKYLANSHLSENRTYRGCSLGALVCQATLPLFSC